MPINYLKDMQLLSDMDFQQNAAMKKMSAEEGTQITPILLSPQQMANVSNGLLIMQSRNWNARVRVGGQDMQKCMLGMWHGRAT